MVMYSKRARNVASVTGVLTAVLFALAGYWVAHGIDGYVITAFNGVDAVSIPLHKSVATQALVPGCITTASIPG